MVPSVAYSVLLKNENSQAAQEKLLILVRYLAEMISKSFIVNRSYLINDDIRIFLQTCLALF